MMTSRIVDVSGRLFGFLDSAMHCIVAVDFRYGMLNKISTDEPNVSPGWICASIFSFRCNVHKFSQSKRDCSKCTLPAPLSISPGPLTEPYDLPA